MSASTDTRRAPDRDEGAGRTRSARSDARGRGAEPAARDAAGQGRAPRIPFVLLVLCLLAGALVSLLVLRGVIAQEAFTITRLQAENRELAYAQQQWRDRVAHLESSERIAQEAEELGMEQPEEAPRFLDRDSGEVLGGTGSTE
ncbi:hypothetical protein BJF83_00240 [Nocardiopsis sp. CNR-923]|uniref:hypothetical protein n=1 Tax=Nocardiopsis sp. CNR-923 TaxID=1904965 RepID=UPI000959FB1F|nr:hypothetical protein [Nocardiopsis sp. CNR-923]OLT29102.1 hypothetical protein BJF83_00240 [Nocardiopsis sp. CNR-923]